MLVTLTWEICHYTGSGTRAQAWWSQSIFRELLHSCHSRWLQGLGGGRLVPCPRVHPPLEPLTWDLAHSMLPPAIRKCLAPRLAP